ncbi:MAG: RHS repeat-associated core domain-containing protein, partial [Chloroflexota bacterium]|nr:RHS repeat-associated core domain-containing protein [Chloroflexota bacterium]
YTAWGTVRYSSGETPTDYTYTGQRSEVDSFGLMYYNARWYDPYLNRWAQPDSIIPNPANPIDWDRYVYVQNNPVRYIDPSGHMICDNYGYCGTSAGRGEQIAINQLFDPFFGPFVGEFRDYEDTELINYTSVDQGMLHMRISIWKIYPPII